MKKEGVWYLIILAVLVLVIVVYFYRPPVGQALGYGSCGNGVCDSGDTCGTCPEDCGLCAISEGGAFCGNWACDHGETCATCPFDCGYCGSGTSYCGDGVCGADEGCNNCEIDCGRCTPLTCTNNTMDGNETDVDCGGNCNPCSEGKHCRSDLDCFFSACTNNTCTISDFLPPLPDESIFTENNSSNASIPNVTTNVTVPAVVAFSCSNSIQDGNESDVDCGGNNCSKCLVGLYCRANADCASNTCIANRCYEDVCVNGYKDVNESDVDCGGVCPKCTTGKVCTRSTDCVSRFCMSGICSVASCGDEVCSVTESCFSCPGDCGSCSSVERARATPTKICTPKWDCTGWGTCNSGVRSRDCFDSNSCNVLTDKPNISESCSCFPDWTCTEWGFCEAGVRHRVCSDSNKCDTTNLKPKESDYCQMPVVTPVVEPEPIVVEEPTVLPPEPVEPSIADLCSNGLQDYNEEGVDCGGDCLACPVDRTWWYVLAGAIPVIVLVVALSFFFFSRKHEELPIVPLPPVERPSAPVVRPVVRSAPKKSSAIDKLRRERFK